MKKANLTLNSVMRGWMFMLSMVLFLSFTACGGGAAPAEAEAETESAEEGDLSFTEEDILALKDKFIFDEETGWYYHKHWNQASPKRRTLTADVMATGYFILTSNFYANKGIKHSKIIATIGETKITSGEVKTAEDDNQTTQDGDRVYETIRYSNYADNGIFQAVAQTSEDQAVNVRFVGAKSYSDAEIPKSDVDAIKDCFYLSIILRQGL
ncbi:MAG: hypothetical protein AAFR66_21845 [Bacteroidota bacterium]